MRYILVLLTIVILGVIIYYVYSASLNNNKIMCGNNKIYGQIVKLTVSSDKKDIGILTDQNIFCVLDSKDLSKLAEIQVYNSSFISFLFNRTENNISFLYQEKNFSLKGDYLLTAISADQTKIGAIIRIKDYSQNNEEQEKLLIYAFNFSNSAHSSHIINLDLYNYTLSRFGRELKEMKFSPGDRYAAIAGEYSISACPSVPGVCTLGFVSVVDTQQDRLLFIDSGGNSRGNEGYIDWLSDDTIVYTLDPKIQDKSKDEIKIVNITKEVSIQEADARDIDKKISEALQSMNLSLCNQARNFSKICYNHVAIAMKKPEFCVNISYLQLEGETPYARLRYQNIYSKYGKNISLGYCVSEASGYDVEACQKISDEIERESCIINTYRKKNITDASFCSFLKEDYQQQECKLEAFNNLCQENSTTCTAGKCSDFEDEFYITKCKNLLAINKCRHNLNSCSKELCHELNFGDRGDEEECIINMANLKCEQNVSQCNPFICNSLNLEYYHPYRCAEDQIQRMCYENSSKCNSELCNKLNNQLGYPKNECNFFVIYYNSIVFPN